MSYYPVGQWAPWVSESISGMTCLNAANAASARLQAQREQLTRDWKVKSFYRVEDMDKIIDQVFALLAKAKDDVTAAKNQGSFTLKSSEYAQWNEVTYQILARFSDARVFTQTIQNAKAKGIKVIDAPGFQNWVEKSLMSVEGAVEVIACMKAIKPSIVTNLETIYDASRALGSFIKTLVEAVIAFGQAVANVPKTVADLWTIMKWGTVAIGGVWLYSKLRR